MKCVAAPHHLLFCCLLAGLLGACPAHIDTATDAGTDCLSTQIRCSGVCVDPASDSAHCGDCSTACPATATCTAGLCECPNQLTACGSACVDTNSDLNNCGQCGHVCPSGSGETTLCSVDGCALVVTLDSRRNFPVGPLVDTTGIYWGITTDPAHNASGAILRTPLGGGQAVTLTTATTPAGLAMDSTNIYWVDEGNDETPSLLSVARGGGATTTLATAIPFSSGTIATVGSAVFWPDSGMAQPGGGYTAGSGAIMGVSLTTMAVSPLVPGVTAPNTLLTDSSFLYWTSLGATDSSGSFVTGSGGIYRIALQSGSTTQTLVSDEDPCVSLAVDATSIYWATIPPGTTASPLKRMALGGGAITTLAALSSEAPFLGVDSRNLYWSTEDTSFGLVPIQGGAAATLVAGTMPGPGGFAAATTGLYWTSSTGNFGDGMLVWLSPQ